MIFFFFAVLGIEPRGILPPSYTPSPIFYYFILKQGLPKLPRLALNLRSFLVTEITGMYYQVQLPSLSPFFLSFFFMVLGIEPRDILSLSYDPSPIFYSLF